MAQVSIIIPMHNEAPNVAGLLREIDEACHELTPYEVICVDDGSSDGTLEALHLARAQFGWLRVFHNPSPAGQSAAVHSGVQAALGKICATMDGDGQNPPAEIPKLVAKLQNADHAVGLVAGQRVGRRDHWSKRVASQIANRIRRWALDDGTRDTGCGLKAFRRDDFIELPFFNHMHRYLPALFAAHGWEIAHVDVAHRPRDAGRSKYTNFGRAVVGMWDLLGVSWLIKRRKLHRAFEVPPKATDDD